MSELNGKGSVDHSREQEEFVSSPRGAGPFCQVYSTSNALSAHVGLRRVAHLEPPSAATNRRHQLACFAGDGRNICSITGSRAPSDPSTALR